MNKRDEFLKSQKVLRLATIDKNKTPHIVPVWYLYSGKKIYIGTNTKTQKAKNAKKTVVFELLGGLLGRVMHPGIKRLFTGKSI